MSDKKLRPEELTSEAIKKAATEHAADEYVQLVGDCLSSFILGAMFARRALFSPAPSEAAKVECPNSFPVGNCPTCGELVAPWNKHAKYEGGYTCQPAPPEPAAPEMPEAVKWAIYQLRQNVRLWEIHGEQPASETDRKTADSLESWWRTHAQPVAVRMTPELERVLEFCDAHNNCKALHPTIFDKEGLRSAIAAVRQQAAQPVRMEKVRAGIELLISKCDPRCNMKVLHYEAMIREMLAELDAYEGKGEGRG